MYEWGLIDLKRLHDDVEYWELHDDPKQPDYDTRDIEDVINRQPIVEAIPIEIIHKRAEGYRNSLIHIPDKKVKQFYETCAYELENLISWWEIEK